MILFCEGPSFKGVLLLALLIAPLIEPLLALLIDLLMDPFTDLLMDPWMGPWLPPLADVLNVLGCEDTSNKGVPDWKPIIDCREELNLALTPPGNTDMCLKSLQ